MSSTRLPGKSLMDINGHPMLWHVLSAAKRISRVDEVILTTPESEDDALGRVATGLGVTWMVTDHSDLLRAFHGIALRAEADVIVRITGDCPLLDALGSAYVIDILLNRPGLAYVSNVGPDTDGLDTECFRMWALSRANLEAMSAWERHHVTPYIRERPELFPQQRVSLRSVPVGDKWSVDTMADLERVRAVFARAAAAR